MRHDPMELRVAKKRGRSRERRAADCFGCRLTIAEKADRPLEVIDEAFADFTRVNERMTRVDQAGEAAVACTEGAAVSNSNIESDGRSVPIELVANLSAQLAALDSQRKQLSQLLRTIDGAWMSR